MHHFVQFIFVIYAAWLFLIFIPPTLKKLKGHIALDLPVSPSVYPFVHPLQKFSLMDKHMVVGTVFHKHKLQFQLYFPFCPHIETTGNLPFENQHLCFYSCP